MKNSAFVDLIYLWMMLHQARDAIFKNRVKRIERKRLTDQIVEQLVMLIRSGKLKIGEKLPPEHELMNQFGVGRSSLREAIGALLLTGVLTSRPWHGTYVNTSSGKLLSKTLGWRIESGSEKVEELIEARIILEQAMAGLSAARATEEDIAEMRHYHDLLKSIEEGKQQVAQVQADLSFHFALAKASRNAILFGFLSEFRNLMLLWMQQTVRPESNFRLSDIIKQHAAILEAVRARDVERAQAALCKHLEASANNLSSVLLHKQLKSSLRRIDLKPASFSE